jgi:hypothetical protein
VALLHDRLKVTRLDGVREEPVDEERWHAELESWFGITGFAPIPR